MNPWTSLSVRLIARSYVPDVTYRVVASPKEFTKVRAGLCRAALTAAFRAVSACSRRVCSFTSCDLLTCASR